MTDLKGILFNPLLILFHPLYSIVKMEQGQLRLGKPEMENLAAINSAVKISPLSSSASHIIKMA